MITGSIRISRRLKISPFIIGATVLGFGTSAPELAVSMLATLDGAPELAMGNVIGSNIANAGLVLGLTALLVPLTIDAKRLKAETPPLIFATFLIMFLAWDFQLSRIEGSVMLLLLAVYLWRTLSKKEEIEVEMEVEMEEEAALLAGKGIAVQSVLVIVGLGLLIVGARFLVSGGVNIATDLGISQWFIGITVVAVGTSMPEIVSSLLAARRGHGEMAIGNVFGSNIFNILMVLGATATLRPLQIHEPIHPDLIYTTALTCFLLILIRLEHKLSKRDGILLLGCYCAYVGLKGAGII